MTDEMWTPSGSDQQAAKDQQDDFRELPTPPNLAQQADYSKRNRERFKAVFKAAWTGPVVKAIMADPKIDTYEKIIRAAELCAWQCWMERGSE